MPRDVAKRTLPADPTADLHAVTKQYCDNNVPTGVLRITWAGSPTTAGVPKSTVSLVSPNCVTANIIVQQPLLVQKFTMDMNFAGTYSMYITSGAYDAGGTPISEILMTIEENVVTAGGNTDWTPATPLLLMPGVYFLTWVTVSGGGTWNVKTASEGMYGTTLFFTEDLYFDGTIQAAAGQVAPLYMTAYLGTLSIS